MEALAAAKENEANFLKGLELDTDDTGDYDPTKDHAEGKADAGDVDTVLGNAATALTSGTNARFVTLGAGDYTNPAKKALQDADMQTAVSTATNAMNTVKGNAKAGMTALLETLAEQEKALADQYKAEFKADGEYVQEETVYATVNGVTMGTGDTEYGFKDGKFGIFDSGDVDTVLAEKVSGSWQLTAAGKASGAKTERFDDLAAKFEALETQKAQTKATEGNLESAVEDILVLENGGHSVADFKDTMKKTAAISGTSEASMVVDLDPAAPANGADIYPDATEAGKGKGEIASFTAVFNALGAKASGTKATFDGVDFGTDSSVNDLLGAWKITAIDTSGGVTTVTLETTAVGKVADVKAADITLADGNTTTITSVDMIASGSDAGVPVTGKKAPNADALKDALEELNALTDAVEKFEEARDIAAELKDLQDEVTDAEKAITDSVEDGGLGINLLKTTAATFTSKDDVYLYDSNKTTATTLANFGKAGDDVIFFGESFDGGLVKITDVNKDNGESGALEIFWKQAGNDVELYVEQKAFAGNGSTASDMVKITLTGVDGNDLDFADGFLTIA